VGENTYDSFWNSITAGTGMPVMRRYVMCPRRGGGTVESAESSRAVGRQGARQVLLVDFWKNGKNGRTRPPSPIWRLFLLPTRTFSFRKPKGNGNGAFEPAHVVSSKRLPVVAFTMEWRFLYHQPCGSSLPRQYVIPTEEFGCNRLEKVFRRQRHQSKHGREERNGRKSGSKSSSFRIPFEESHCAPALDGPRSRQGGGRLPKYARGSRKTSNTGAK